MADLLSAISVFLVFLTFLVNATEKQVEEVLQKRKPEKEQIEKYKEFQDDLKRLLYLKLVPISLAFLLSFYILFPKSFSIISTSKFSLWYFNPLETLYVLIDFGILCLFVFTFFKTIQIINKINE